MGAGGGREGGLMYHLSENPVSFIHTLFPDSSTWSAQRIDSSVPGIVSWHRPWPFSSQGNKGGVPPTEQQFSSCGGSNRADPLILNGLAWALFYCHKLQEDFAS